MKATAVSVPVAMTVAGSDCSSGAGLQADLKTFSAFGVYGLTAVTCVVAEIPGKVTRIQPVGRPVLEEQLRLLLGGFPVAAVKTGMLFSRPLIEAVAVALTSQDGGRRPALVVDPVMVATSGDPLLQRSAVRAFEQRLFPLAEVITPNLDEAAVLLGREVRSARELEPAAAELRDRYGCAVLLKGGHLRGKTAVDVLADGEGTLRLEADYVRGVETHGTGCTYSAAIASGIAQGNSLRAAVAGAKEYVSRAIGQPFRWGRGGQRIDALNHFRQVAE
jgi:hydroxymethylpyrimidine/phosphomethylpyrimidine kinase